MVGSPLGRKCKTNGSIHSEVVEKHLEGRLPTPMSSVRRYPVLSSKKGAQILKKNSSHALNTKVLSGKETGSTRELRSAETRKRSSFSSPTISSSRKTCTEKQKGLDETFHSSEITCPLCENDLSDMPDEYANEYAAEYHDDIEPSVLPSVAILSCGHSFHAVCLVGITPEENSSDPPCFFCLSCID